MAELERDVEFDHVLVTREEEGPVETPVGPKNILEVLVETSEELFGACGGTLFEKFENGMTGTLTDGLSAKQLFGLLVRKVKSTHEV